MNLQQAEKLALDLMETHGLIDKKWFFRFNNRRRAAGVCKQGDYCIELSKHITALADEHEVKDTILHEIAHALVGRGHGHDQVWINKAKEIGCDGLRCYDESNKPSTTLAYQLVAKYKGVCPNGHESFVNRMPTRTYSCHKCSPKFNRDFIVVFSPNS